MFADACSFESSRVESARMHAFHENLIGTIQKPESKDIKRVHSVKNAVFRTSHGFAKLTPFTRHQKHIYIGYFLCGKTKE